MLELFFVYHGSGLLFVTVQNCYKSINHLCRVKRVQCHRNVCHAVPAEFIKAFCADILSSSWHGNMTLLQCMLCINRLRVSYRYAVQKYYSGLQSLTWVK